MATISKTGITNGNSIEAEHITRIIDALDGTVAREISVHQANVNYLYLSSSAYQISQNNAGSIVFNAQDNDQDTIISHFGGNYSSSFTENGLITNAAITASGFQGTASFASTASYALNATSAGGSEYMTIRLSHAKQTGTIDSTTSYFGAGTHTVKDGINRAGAILPFNCQVISASFYTSTDVQGAPTITYRLYADVTGTPTVLANGPTLDLSSFMDASAQAIGSGTIPAGKYVNVRMTENGDDPTVEFTSTVDLLIKKV